MKTHLYILMLLLMVLTPASLYSQYNTQGLSGGLGFGGTVGITESSSRLKMITRGFLRQGIVERVQLEISAGIGQVGGPDYNTRVIPLDGRALFSPFIFDSWNPYIYAGYGGIHFKVEEKPVNASSNAKLEDWAYYIPVGIGAQFQIDDSKAFEISGGYNYTTTADVDAVRKAMDRDKFWNFYLGITAASGGNPDPDNDGLSNDVEKQLGTDPNKADTDGDGLSDGDEVNVYKTNPLKADSDGDGLNDGDEIKVYKTDPNKADTDGDGLKDGDEVLKYHTDPLKVDTDGDGLSDGDEVLKYHTDPLKKDTDGGGIDDGTEIARGTNPLDPADDMPKKEEPKKEEVKPVEPQTDISKVEKGQSITLEGILFETGSAKITPASEAVLAKVIQTLKDNPDINVEIQGHTDNKGRESANLKLSERRANSVKTYLVTKGIEKARLTSKGFGQTKPVASNDTPEGREKNRRIEFLRTK
jgi:outer membrane protein OmpA-like peptidoglycan-associated protein